MLGVLGVLGVLGFAVVVVMSVQFAAPGPLQDVQSAAHCSQVGGDAGPHGELG